MSSTTQKAPVESFRFQNVSIGIFENESNSDGVRKTYFRAKIDKRYCDPKTKKWQSCNSFSADELLRLQHVIHAAVSFMKTKPAPQDGSA